jgi:cytidylate kinase
MAVITISGEPGCRTREVARLTAQRMSFTHLGADRLEEMIVEEFAPAAGFPDKAWPWMAASILLRLATEENLVVGVDGAELLFPRFPALLRVRVVAPENRRTGNVMLDDRLDRPSALQQVKKRDTEARAQRRRRFGRATAPGESFDLTLNTASMDGAHLAAIIESAAKTLSLPEIGLLSKAAEAQSQFDLRLKLAKVGIHPRGPARMHRAEFSHPSEEIFANLLDFYRIAWEYEPKSFPIAWDEDGKVRESFTPDFYLPESDLYVELTAMKQSLVTRKNRKVRLLKELYPHVQIQVFYQKDLQHLVFKYGLLEKQPV